MGKVDYLFYAHDGKGLGHVSRTIAICLSLKRYQPDLRVLLMTGCQDVEQLIDKEKLEWIKLPSYFTNADDQYPKSIVGTSNVNKKDVTQLRKNLIKEIVNFLKPNYLLIDHNPFGKHNELKDLIIENETPNTKFLLGLRGIYGDGDKMLNKEFCSFINKYFHAVFWYGDQLLYGTKILLDLRENLTVKVIPTGLISRAFEIKKIKHGEFKRNGIEGTKIIVNISWRNTNTNNLLKLLFELIEIRNKLNSKEEWVFYIGSYRGKKNNNGFVNKFPNVIMKSISSDYLKELYNSELVLTYGGYNSISDIIAFNKKAIVILRETCDSEQIINGDELNNKLNSNMKFINESDLNLSILNDLLDKTLTINERISTENFSKGTECIAEYLLKENYYENTMDNTKTRALSQGWIS